MNNSVTDHSAAAPASAPVSAPVSAAARPFDLVILDVDGTIYHPHPKAEDAPDADPAAGANVHAMNQYGFRHTIEEMIARVQASGVPVTIASGRTLDFIRERLVPMGIALPVVSTQGALVADPLTGHVLRMSGLPLEEARQLAAWADSGDRICALYFVDDEGHTHIIQNVPTPPSPYYDDIIGSPRAVADSMAALLADDDARLPIKMLMVSEAVSEHNLPDELQARFGAGVHVARTHPLLVEVTAAGVDKGTGVQFLLEHLGIEPTRVLAIGDNDNDVSMFQLVGMSVAMASGSANAKAAARWIAPGIENDGAVVAMQRLVLARETLP